MTRPRDLLIKSLTSYDRSRDRSKQEEIGPSAVGGCKRQAYFIIKKHPVTNPDTEDLAAIMGTFIHAGIAEVMKREDPFGDNFLIEQEFVVPDVLMGHCDLFIKDEGLVIDWKTTLKKSLRYFPSEQQRWQVQLYGWLISQNGYQVNNVSLGVIPRDGKKEEIRDHVEPYDEKIAHQALAWIDEIRVRADNDDMPAAEKWAGYCASYCKYFDATGEVGCPGSTK